MLDINQITNPAGAATLIALPRTNKVLSNIDLTITLPICGFLYGGISKTNDDGIPLRMVLDKILDTKRVTIMANTNTPVRIILDFKLLNVPTAKNMVMMAISPGNLPLHGTNALVRIAISLSLGESIILHPTTPHALQPRPMHIERACFP